MTTIKQIIVEHEGQIYLAVIPDGVNHLMLSILQTNESGAVQLVKLPADMRLISLSEQPAETK